MLEHSLAPNGYVLARQEFGAKIAAILLGISASGAMVACLLLFVAIPLPAAGDRPVVLWGTLGLVAVYSAGATLLGVHLGIQILEPVGSWLGGNVSAREAAERRVLEAPLKFATRIAALWSIGALIGTLYTVWFDHLLSLIVGLGFALAGMFASTLTFLVAERALRPLAIRVLTRGAPRRNLAYTLSKRLVVIWALSSGAGLLGLVLSCTVVLTRPRLTSPSGLATTTVVLAGVIGVSGLLATLLSARATAEPVEDLIDALSKVQAGDYDSRVRVWDSSELGVLQSGFNVMVQGLQERERVRALFGRHVGEAVATSALLYDTNFEGQARKTTVLFVDLAGSTTLAESTDPAEVVALLNRFFRIVIDEVHGHGGWINKFVGDAALAVWGAPRYEHNHVTSCLSASRALARRLAEEIPELVAGIGVSGGTVITGNIGDSRRYEYTVIGDPVNEAARLTEIAKTMPTRLAANADILDQATSLERKCWTVDGAAILRGRSIETRLAVPRA